MLQILLEAAAERQSEACGMAALALLSAAAAAAHTLGQLAGEQLLGPVLHLARLLVQVSNVCAWWKQHAAAECPRYRPATRAIESVMGSNIIGSSMQHMVSHQDARGMSMQTMVGHPAAGIRDAGFHALEDVLMALQPGGPAECAAAAGQHGATAIASRVAHVAECVMEVV